MGECLSRYAERNGQETFQKQHYPEPREHTLEVRCSCTRGAARWERRAAVPACGGGGLNINHQLYFKRSRSAEHQPTTRLTV